MIPPYPHDTERKVSGPEASGRSGTFDLLLDMELPLLVRFGSTRMLLSELTKLTVGSVIEFGASAENPVEVLVNGRVVARGIAVVVQGNYGVRITEIAAARDSLSPDSGFIAAPPHAGREN